FGEKYGDEVRVVTIGAESVELCGGTHVARSGDIGLFALTSEGGVAQGVRRVEAVTGMGAVAFVQERALILDGLQGELHAPDVRELPDRLDRLKGELKAREREVGELKRKLATGGGGEAGPVTVEGVKLMARVVAVSDPKALREAADTLRSRLGSGVVVLGAAREDKAVLLVAATPDLKGRVHAGKLVAALAEHVGGRGGGRPDLAQAGGPNPAGLPAAIDAAPAILEAQLRGSMAS
ncbi:MAG: alanine--tRNA ligase, partial [Myxococcales bacterium]|nr:alanine--tRNA ligase [Myxococcales bacterium]